VKTFLKTLAFVLLAAAIPAAAVVMPMRIPFQGKLIDPATNNPKNGSFSMVFKIWDAPTGGNQLFTESQTVAVANGVFSVQIGTISYLSADMLSGTSAYLGVTVGADSEMAPRQPLSMSPYAYTALQLASDKNIRINSGVSYSTFTTDGNLTLQYGLVGTTGTFTGSSFSVGTSSFVVAGGSATVGYRMQAGSFLTTASMTASGFFGDGSALSNVPGGNVSGNAFTVGATSFTVGGGSATVAYGLTAGNYLATGKNGWYVGASSITTTGGLFGASGAITDNSFTVGTSSFVVAGGSATVAYRLSAGSFAGDGSALTNISAISGNAFTVGATSFTVGGGSATVAYRLTAGNYLATGPSGFYVGSSSITTGGGLFGNSAVISGDIFNVGTSSFVVAGGSATVGYQLSAAKLVGTGVGTFSVTTSSGISMGDGTLKIAAGSDGIDAIGTGITATTGTFMTVTATNTGTFSIISSSGISMADGTLKIAAGSKGIDASGTGITASSVGFVGAAVDPVGIDGLIYYNSSSSTLKQYSTSGGWQWMYPLSPIAVAITMSTNSNTAVKAANGTLLLTPLTLSGPMQVNAMIMRVTIALGLAGDIGVYNSTGGLVLNGGAGSVSTALGLKTVAPIQTGAGRWLPPGQYYVGMTWNNTTGIISGLNVGAAGAVPRCGSLATGGATVPLSITPSSIANGVWCYFFVLSN
jgi:hypothetical protein